MKEVIPKLKVSLRRDDRGEEKEQASQDKAGFGGRELRSWLTAGHTLPNCSDLETFLIG